ncbi:hypothetical protein B0H17DRAFT_1128318 [Mycena rosella]|uniref:F-box domain-containing protein n=1 Tax=Mycena rosella TaxID=1033263 RepID=A0AAD7GPN2_MYCRO|nr:hypothetical protein B0H17DRAFT_1128318 [Mycena rosella]
MGTRDDMLTEIFRRPEVKFEDILQISMTSHHFRALVIPMISGMFSSGSELGSLNSENQVLPACDAGAFLPQLEQLEIASFLPGDRLLSALPSELTKLSIIEYPPLSDLFRNPVSALRASEVLDALGGVYLPAVTHLELWYFTYASDERFLRHLPHAFPSLRHLEMRRFIGRGMDDTWNPRVHV